MEEKIQGRVYLGKLPGSAHIILQEQSSLLSGIYLFYRVVVSKGNESRLSSFDPIIREPHSGHL